MSDTAASHTDLLQTSLLTAVPDPAGSAALQEAVCPPDDAMDPSTFCDAGSATKSSPYASLSSEAAQVLDRMRDLLNSKAPLSDWMDLTGGRFQHCRHEPPLLGALLALCRNRMPLPMATALYTACGAGSRSTLRNHPHLRGLFLVLTEYMRLPLTSSPAKTQEEVILATDAVLNGMERLLELPPSSFLWQQAFQTADFLELRIQPYFLLRLDDFLEGRPLPQEFSLPLSEACADVMLTSPCAAGLSRRLPPRVEHSAWPQPELYAANLLTEGAEYFFHVSRKKILSLLQRTARDFRHSTNRQPWDYVFTRPQFAMVRNDPVFLEKLASFVEGSVLPRGIWLSLNDIYSHELAHERDDASSMGRIRKAAEMALAESCGEEGTNYPHKTFSLSLWLAGLAMLAIVFLLCLAIQH